MSETLEPTDDQHGFSNDFEYDSSLHGYAASVAILDGTNVIRPRTPVVLLARIWNRKSNLMYRKEDVSRALQTIYKIKRYGSNYEDWIQQRQTESLDSFVEIGNADWNYDETEYNFICNASFNDAGLHYVQTKIWFVDPDILPMTITHKINVRS